MRMLGGRFWALMLLLLAGSGCAALTPVRGVPARKVPPELRGFSREGRETIDLSRLVQTPPPEHLCDSGDLLAVYVEGILGRPDEIPPVFMPQTHDVPPSIGFPLPVRGDGTISLPGIPPLSVRGMTVGQVEQLIRHAYTQVDGQQILQPHARIFVAVQQPRSYKVLVLRQESGAAAQTTSKGSVNLGETKRGTGRTLTLPVYQNDVLHALADSGGLPGLDAENAIYVIRQRRNRPQFLQPAWPAGPLPMIERMSAQMDGGAGGPLDLGDPGRERLPPPLTTRPSVPGSAHSAPPRSGSHSAPPYGGPAFAAPQVPLRSAPPLMPAHIPAEIQGYAANADVIRIPVRLAPGEEVPLSESDILLFDGDIVFIESRETEIFYTGGLLGGGQYTLPRDYDLDVLGAISIASADNAGGSGGGFGNRVGGISALNQDISVSASNVVILRRLPDGTQYNIKVNLHRALRGDPNERILIQPGDYVILQYKPHEAIAAFIERNLLAGSLIGLATTQGGGRQ